MDNTSLGNRMKGYESSPKIFLTRRMPVIIRLDGKAFHSFTKTLDKPYDVDFKTLMMETAKYLVENIMGCKLAYVQSDEISLLLVDYNRIESEAWYSNNLQKMVSVSSSMATAIFNKLLNDSEVFPKEKLEKIRQSFALFDSRAFCLPREEVNNYFLWRQNDATRNSVQGLGQANFSHKTMQGKNNNQVQEMLITEKGINWNDIEPYFKRGGCVYRGVEVERRNVEVPNTKFDMELYRKIEIEGTHIQLEQRLTSSIIVDNDIPKFSVDVDYIESHVFNEKTRRTDQAFIVRNVRDIASDLLGETINDNSIIKKIGVLHIDPIIKDDSEAIDE